MNAIVKELHVLIFTMTSWTESGASSAIRSPSTTVGLIPVEYQSANLIVLLSIVTMAAMANSS